MRRAHGRRFEVLCLRRTANPRWVQRGLGQQRALRGRRSQDTNTSIEFPSTLRGAVKIDLPGRLGVTGWQMRNVPAAPLVEYSSGARYSTDQYDVLYETGFGHLKESIVVHQRQGTKTWTWRLLWTRGTRPRIDSAGRIVYGGKVVLARPEIMNSRGKVVMRPRWKLNGRFASFTVRDSRLQLPYVVDPTADFPQRIYPTAAAGTNVTGSEVVATAAGAASSCTKLPIDAVGQSIYGSMIARSTTPGAAIATAVPSPPGVSANGWAIQDGTASGGVSIFAIDAATDSAIYAAGQGGLVLRSLDGGCSWTRLTSGTTNDLRGISAPSSSVVWVAGSNGTVRRSTNADGAGTFAAADAGVPNRQLWAIDALDANIAMLGGASKTLYYTNNGGGTWTDKNEPNMGDVWDVDINGTPGSPPYVAWAVTSPSKVYRANNLNGTTNPQIGWKFQNVQDFRSISALDDDTAWAVGALGVISVTTNGSSGGWSWTPQVSGTTANLHWVDVLGTNSIYAGGSGGTILYYDGTTWTTQANAANGAEIFAGTARSAGLAWVGDATGVIQARYPAGGQGSFGWTSAANGGTTLAAGPWTIGARTCREPYSTGSASVGFRARVWKVQASAGSITASTPMTPWSASSGTVALAGGACANQTVAVTPTMRTLLPTEYFYVEYALVSGSNRAQETVSLQVGDTGPAGTWVDFGAPAVNDTPVPPNLRIASAIGGNGWTNDTTPTLQADLADPDWYHHIRFQVCADDACTVVVAEGTSPANQLLGSVNGAWTVPTPLGDGFYYMRARTEEDGGDGAISAWTPISPLAGTNLCTASGVGPCDKFGVDTGPPTATGPVNDGLAADIAYTPSASTLSANWGPATDGAGAVTYETCISTMAPCAGTIVGPWLSNGLPTTMTRTGLALVNGTTYYTCVRAFDNAGNAGPTTCSNGVLVDTAAPPATAAVRDGLGADEAVTPSATQLESNWDAVADIAPGSGLASYDVCFSTSSTGADCAGAATSPWTTNGVATSVTRTGLALTHATTYYTCVRAIDNVANVGATRCSDGIVVDLLGPTWPGGSQSNDGPGPGDVTWTTSTTTLESNWTAATDPSGILRYEYCLSTATACGGTVVKGWTSNALALTQSSAGLALVHGQTYYSCVRAFDTVGNVGSELCSDGQTVDAVAPTLPTIVNDGTGADITWLLSLTTASANWTGGGDADSGIANWEYCIATGAACTGTVVKTWTANGTSTTQTSGALPLVEGEIYYTCVRATDVAGNASAGSACSDGQRVDTVAPPATPVVNDGPGADIAWQFSDTTINANWSAVVDPVPGVGTESGLQRYQYCITTSATGADCAGGAVVSWNTPAVPTSTTISETGLSLTNGSTYHVCVRSNDNATNVSGVACSNGVIIDTGPPAASWTSWTVTNDDPANPHMYSPGGNLLWFNPWTPPGMGGVATATVTATDPGAGMNRVEFPNLGATGWGPGGTDTTVGPGDTWTWDYTVASGTRLDPALNNATAYDNGGASTGSPALDFDIRPDSTPPASSATVPAMGNGLQNTTMYSQSIPLGTDADSGIARWEMDVQFAPLYDNACGAWDPWIPSSSLPPGYSGPASNGSTLILTHYLNDPDLNGIPDYKDAFCFRTRVWVIDHVSNYSLLAENGYQRFDFGEPDVSITTPADGSAINLTATITGSTDDVWPGGGWEYVDTGSGVDRVEVTYQHQTLPAVNGSACPPATPTGAWPAPLSWSCAWNTVLTGNDGWYDVTATAYDRAGNASGSVTYSYLVDNFAPVTTWHSWYETSPSMHSVGNVAWVRPGAPIAAYQLDARVTASDLGSGVDRVEFPGFGAGWTPAAGPNNAAFTSPLPVVDAYTMSYTFTDPSLLAAPGVLNATAFDGAGNSTDIPFEVRLDGSAPTGMTASVPGTLQNGPIVNLTLGAGNDGALGSGLAGWTMLYDSAPIVGGVCGAFSGSWTVFATGSGPAPASRTHDVTALGSRCYSYILQVSDNVGNMATSPETPTPQRVDLDPPVVAITGPTDGETVGASVPITGTVTEDHTLLDHVAVTWTGPGPGPTSGTVCDPATQVGIAPNWTFSCTWDTNAPTNLPDGAYTITAIAYDTAGNASAPHTINVTLDKNPPVVTFHSFDTSATTWAYWAGGAADPLWYNPDAPAGSHSFDVRVDAVDIVIDRVEFDGAGAGWTPGGAVGTETVPIGPATRYSHTYSFTGAGTAVDPPTLDATAFDAADNPGSAPFEFTADTADPALGAVSSTNGYVPSTTVVVDVATGDDGAGSGIRSWELLRDTGTLSGGACSGWTGYTTSVATGLGQFTGTQNDVVGDPSCARYRLVVTDNVGRIGTFDATEVTTVDLTPPTGTIVLSEGATGGQYQFLANPTRLFVNTNAGAAGDFQVDVTAAAASGILDVTFPPIAAGFTGNGVAPGPGPNFPRTYSWTGPAGVPGALSADVRSNSLGALSLPFEVVADAAGPTSASPTHSSGFTTGTSVSVTWTAASDGAGSGVAAHNLQRETGTLAAGSCAWNNDWADVGGATTPGTTVDNTLVTATCYRYRTRATDNVANDGFSPPSTPIMVDTTPPIGASILITEGTAASRQHVIANDQIWVAEDPAGPASFTVTVTANDPESGTGAALFPALGSTFVLVPGGPFDASYTWSAPAVAPGAPVDVTVGNGAGLTTTIPFEVFVDAAAPVGASIDQEAGFVTDFLVDLTYAFGADADSGLASQVVERREAVYDFVSGTCGAYGAWTAYPFPSGDPGGSPHVDGSVVQPTCYQYRLTEVDNVGNVRNTDDGDTVIVINDFTPPEPFSLVLPTNPALPAITTAGVAPSCETVPTYATATPNLSWNPTTDSESGLSHYDVFVDGTATADATVPAPGTSWTPPALAAGGHTLGVQALDFQANARDADPAFPTDFRIDLAAPTGSLVAPAMGSWTSDTTPTLDWNAADDNCLARIEVFVDGSPVAIASGTEGSWTPAAPLADGAHTWSFDAIDSMGNVSSFGPFTFGVDTIPPSASTITAPTAGQTVRGFVDVAWTAASDAESGLAPAAAYQVWIDGVLRATVAAGTTTATVSPITLGGHSVVVRSIDLVGNFTDSAPVLFTGYPTIPAPVLLSPAAGAFLDYVPSLDWNWPSDGGPPPTDYDVYLDGVLDGNELHPTMTHAIADPGDGTHSWYVEQHDPYTGTVTSVTRTFTIDRTPPVNLGPLTRVGTVVSWPAPTDPSAPVASGIDYQEFWIDDGTNPPTFATRSATTTSHDYGLLPDGTYTMWVRAYDRAGNFTDSPTLVVMNDSVPPTPFNLVPPPALPALPAITHGSTIAPACETVPTFVGATPTLQWTASSDATSGLAGYDIRLNAASIGTEGPAATSHVPGTPIAGGAYTWGVVASDNFGLTRQSTPSAMSVRVDALPPAINYSSPADGAFTSDTTPAFTWAGTDDNCLARIELTVGTDVYVLTGTATGYTPSAVLPEGPTTWSVRAYDSAGNVVSAGPARTVNIDTTPPSGISAIFPANASTVPEGMLTFQWSAGTDGIGSGVTRYDLVIDGSTVATGLTTTSNGTHQILGPPLATDPPAPHTWSIRVYDAVGNSAVFPFNFAASFVPDTTPPDPFDLLTPADMAPVPAGTPLTWAPSWDFKGVTQYRIYIDGVLAGTVPGTTTTFTPSAGAGAPICAIDYDPATSAGCLTGPLYSHGVGAGTTASGLAVSPHMNISTYAGWAASGASLGVGDPTVAPVTQTSAGFDGDRVWTAVEYAASIPAAGADIRFEHRYLTHTIGENAYDGATVELKVDDEGNGFGDDLWESTCEFDAKPIYGVTLDCVHPIVDLAGGYNAVMGGADKDAHPLSGQHSFAGDSGGTVQTRMSMADFAGMNVRIRFRIGTDSCYTGMNASYEEWCDMLGVDNEHPVLWRIDEVTLANPSLLPGPHTWYVQARDAAGNVRNSNQTWTFDLQP